MNFADILTSSIHDIKNSLGMIINNLEVIIGNPENKIVDRTNANLLQHELQRANNNLIQLLSLYNLDNQRLPVSIQERNLDDLLSELVLENQGVCANLGIALEYQCDPFLNGFFDEDLVRGVLNSTIGNAQRYSNSRILLSAEQGQGFLVLRVEDDGAGYPQSMQESLATDQADNGMAFTKGRTQLGLFFAHQIARLHKADGRTGHIRLRNHHQLPGGCFELWLP